MARLHMINGDGETESFEVQNPADLLQKMGEELAETLGGIFFPVAQATEEDLARILAEGAKSNDVGLYAGAAQEKEDELERKREMKAAAEREAYISQRLKQEQEEADAEAVRDEEEETEDDRHCYLLLSEEEAEALHRALSEARVAIRLPRSIAEGLEEAFRPEFRT